VHLLATVQPDVRLVKRLTLLRSSHLTAALVMSAKQEPEGSQHAEVVANAAAEALKPGADTVRLSQATNACCSCLLLLLLPPAGSAREQLNLHAYSAAVLR
jgi:hypothetical protein